MHTCTKSTLAALGGATLAALALWWLADHRRGIAWAVSVVRRLFSDVSHLSPSALDAWLRESQRPTPQIVDARSEEEFAVSHLASAVRVDPKSNASAALSTLDPERPIVIYCSAGYRGATLARRLQDAGRPDVWNLEGGIFAWTNAGLPVERAGQNTKRVHPYSRFFTRLLKPQKPEASDASKISGSGESGSFTPCSLQRIHKNIKKGCNMKIRNTMGLVTFIGVFALLSATDASAQGRGANQGSGGWGPQAAYNRKYDPKTVETLSGEVTTMDKMGALIAESFR